jgi:hypothetical protein
MRLAALAAALSAAACQSGAQLQDRPAVLKPDRMDEVVAALSAALGRSAVELGPLPEVIDAVTVLPPRLGAYEDRSPALPRVFDVVARDGNCVLIERAGPVEVELDRTICST